jgi:hypothetical protein
MRKTKTVTIEEEGRDKGKVFIVTEMPASQAEKWALRALVLAAKSGVDIPDDIADAGMAGIAVLGIKTVLGGMDFEDVEPLLDEMFSSCLSFVPDPNNLAIRRGKDGIAPMIEEDIEEITTRIHLRAEVLNIHTGFLDAGARLNTTSAKVPAGRSKPKMSRRQSRR